MRTLPINDDNHTWSRRRGKRRRPRVVQINHVGTPATPNEGKAAEGGRGSSSEGDAPTQTRQRRPGGSREGQIPEGEDIAPTEWDRHL